MTRAETFVANIRKRGSDANDVRDAAHEACHAMEWGIKGKWKRETITNKNPWKRRPTFGVRDEITARAVEALVCEKLGIEHKLDTWVLMMIMETLKLDNIALPSFEWTKDAIIERMHTKYAKDLADKLLDTFAPAE